MLKSSDWGFLIKFKFIEIFFQVFQLPQLFLHWSLKLSAD
jgi:hypothetical protein